MPESKNLLQSFKQSKDNNSNLDMQEARRLVNLYRALSCFGEEFVEKYNQMLLTSAPGVRRLLRTFMGGDEVLEYYEFLHQNVPSSEQDTSDKKIVQSVAGKGYLPEPEEDISSSQVQGMSIPQSEFDKIKEQQKTLSEQVQLLLRSLKQQSGSPYSSNEKNSSSFDSYSEIIEEESDGKGGK